jgi:hypothetical protein
MTAGAERETEMSDTTDSNIEPTNTADTGDRDTGADRFDHGENARHKSVRETLRNAFKEHADDADRDDDDQKRDDRKPFERPGRSAREAKAASAADAKARDVSSSDTKATSADPAAPSTAHGQIDTTQPPKSWRAEEKRHYDSLPQQIKQAIHRREADMQAGVESMKQKYASMEREYSDLSRALEPHLPVIRSFGHTPAQSVSQMFAWFDALSKRPDESFPVFAAVI